MYSERILKKLIVKVPVKCARDHIVVYTSCCILSKRLGIKKRVLYKLYRQDFDSFVKVVEILSRINQ